MYSLRGIGLSKLPVTIYRDSLLEISVSAATVTLASDSTFVDARTYRVVISGGAPAIQHDTLFGAYSLAGDKINLVAVNGDPYQMVWQGRLLTWYAEGFTFRYEK